MLTIEEFCLQYKVSRASVYRLIRIGLPSALVPGMGRRIYDPEAINWIKAKGYEKKPKKAKQ